MSIKGIRKNILLGIIMGSFTLLACNKKEIKSVMDKNEVIVGLDDAFAPMGFKDESGEIYYAYCVDKDTRIQKNHDYSRVNVEDSDYYSESDAKQIRAIVNASIPVVAHLGLTPQSINAFKA